MKRFSMLAAIAVLSSSAMPSVAYGECNSEAEAELRFAAVPEKSDEEARSEFLNLCRESEREQRDRVECGGEMHSTCFCGHFNARKNAKEYLKTARVACQTTQRAASGSECMGNASAESCITAASRMNHEAADGEERTADRAASAREEAGRSQQRVNGTRRTLGRELSQVITLNDKQLARPTVSSGR